MDILPNHFFVTHDTDWRRVRWVHDHEYMGLVDAVDYADNPEDTAVAQRELEDLQNGLLVCLGAIVETRCPHCTTWIEEDSLWNIVVPPDEDLEALGSELLEIPEKPPENVDLREVLESALPVVEMSEKRDHGDCPTADLMRAALAPSPPEERKPRGPGLASIVLQFDPDTLSALQNAVYVRRLTGQSAGLLDAFTGRLIQKIGEGAAVWEVKQKGAD